MNKTALIGGLAVAVGLAGAATALHVLKPQDRPIALPGVEIETVKQEPPVIVPLGAAGAQRRIHLVVGDDLEAGKAAYRVLQGALNASPSLGGNVVPAATEGSELHKAFAWVLASGPQRETLLDGLMGTSGAITDSALTVIAQNAGLDAAALSEKAKDKTVADALSQARLVLPPSTPAIYANGTWLTGVDLSATGLANALNSASTEQNDVANTAAVTVVENAHAFATPPKAQVAAAFLTLHNKGNAPIAIVAAETPAASRVELHGHTMDENGVMQMRPVPQIDVPAGGSVTLKPSGLHIMMFELPAPLVVGQRFPLTLTLSDGQAISTLVSVTPPGQVLTHGHHSE